MSYAVAIIAHFTGMRLEPDVLRRLPDIVGTRVGPIVRPYGDEPICRLAEVVQSQFPGAMVIARPELNFGCEQSNFAFTELIKGSAKASGKTPIVVCDGRFAKKLPALFYDDGGRRDEDILGFGLREGDVIVLQTALGMTRIQNLFEFRRQSERERPFMRRGALTRTDRIHIF